MSSTQPSPEPTGIDFATIPLCNCDGFWHTHSTDDKVSQYLDDLVQEAIRQAVAAKNAAYGERNNLVAFMSKLFPSHLANDPKEPLWAVVCIHTPNGQMAWHIPLEEVGKFTHLTPQDNDWDGHTTKDKYRRLANLTPGEDV